MRHSLLSRTFGFLHKLKVSNLAVRRGSHPCTITMSTEVGAANLPINDVLSMEKTEKTDACTGTKRPSSDNPIDASDGATDSKKPKTEGQMTESSMSYTRPFYQKRKVAMLIVYSGKGYTGMQMNPGMKTIEQDLLDALCKAGVVTEDHVTKPGIKMGFQRAARTDKGVSAAGQLVSLKMNVENAVEKINSHLVDQVRVIGFKRVTRGFSSKDTCCSRTYIYMLPTFAFTPIQEFVTENFKMSASLRDEVNRVLAHYKGTHKFHNFTSGKKSVDPSSQRYIMDFKIGEPFMNGNIEYAVISVKGQSFMLHQIRKMIGLAIAIVRGLAADKSIEYAWRPEKADVPMAPSLGLLLDQLHFDAYNKRFGSDGQHVPIKWDEFKDEIEAFKHKYIYSTIIETELKERSMMKWLATLHNHHFEARTLEHNSIRDETKLGKAANNLRRLELGLSLDNGDATTLPATKGMAESSFGVNLEATEGTTNEDTHTSKQTDDQKEFDINKGSPSFGGEGANNDVTEDVTFPSLDAVPHQNVTNSSTDSITEQNVMASSTDDTKPDLV